VLDKHVYSPWLDARLHNGLQERGVDTLIVSGGETDVCVLATILGAIDRGYHVVIAVDAVCSSADETHDAMMTLYESRFGQQIQTANTAEIVERWSRA
jgi:nicotinamidase-related amidase